MLPTDAILPKRRTAPKYTQEHLNEPADPRIARLDAVANALDSQFRIPGTGIRFGWDSILGLVPGLGDAATLVPALWLLFEGYRLGARGRTLARMATNTVIDAAIGAIPFLGDVFDVAFKSNQRNVDLLRKDLRQSPRI